MIRAIDVPAIPLPRRYSHLRSVDEMPQGLRCDSSANTSRPLTVSRMALVATTRTQGRRGRGQEGGGSAP